MTETVYGFGEDEARSIAEVNRRVLGNGAGTRVESFDNPVPLEPVAVQLSEVPEPGIITPAVLQDSQLQEVRPIDIQCLENIAIPVGRFGFAITPPRFLAVLIEDLQAAAGIYATGTITAGTDQLTTSVNLSAFIDDYTVVVCGAGADGEPLQTTIDSATPTVATLGHLAATDVTDAEVTILSVADVWILERNECGRLVRKRIDGELVTKPVVNDFHEITAELDTLIGIEWQEGFWVPYKMDCEPFAWEWLEVSE